MQMQPQWHMPYLGPASSAAEPAQTIYFLSQPAPLGKGKMGHCFFFSP
jgi:hypothetical protein